MRNRKSRIAAMLLAASVAAGSLPGYTANATDVSSGTAQTAQGDVQSVGTAAGEFQKGNSSLNIQNGGLLTEEECDVTPYLGESGYSNLNVFASHIYYVSDANVISVIDRNTGTIQPVYTPAATVSQMYVVNDSVIYYLAAGNVYRYDMTSQAQETLMASGDVQGFIPTAYGVIYARGTLFSWNLTAGETAIANGVYQYYEQEGYLVYTKEGQQYQAALASLFAGAGTAAIESYSLGNDEASIAAYSEHTEADACAECLANAQNYNEADFAASDQVSLGATDAGEISAYASNLTASQQAMIQRAEEQAKRQWTPVKNVASWANSTTFLAGTTYTGIPYGQPVYAKYVPYAASFAEFDAAVKNGNSKFYTERSTFGASAPYYSSDCSSFVSYCWGLSGRHWTGNLGQAGVKQLSNIYSVQVGDILLHQQEHVLMIADITYRNGQIVSITTVEQTPPRCEYKVWGEGGTWREISDLYKYYLNQGYDIWRAKSAVTPPDNTKPVTPTYPDTDVRKFSDVAEGFWFYEYVKYVFDAGYMTGMTDTYFGAADTLSRAQFVTLLYRMEGEPNVSYLSAFSDVPQGTFYSKAATWANNAGIMEGYENGMFGASDNITREQMVTILYRYAKYKGKKPAASGNLSVYPDASGVSGFATDAMKWAVRQSIISGDGGRLKPQGEASRASCATMIQRYKTNPYYK